MDNANDAACTVMVATAGMAAGLRPYLEPNTPTDLHALVRNVVWRKSTLKEHQLLVVYTLGLPEPWIRPTRLYG